MQKITVGIDIAKNIFHLVWLNSAGKVLKRAKCRRKELLGSLRNIEPATVAMEACGGAFYWAREIQASGHEVKIIAPQYVVPFRKGNKNDYNDAIAIAEASQRASMRFVPLKSVEQQSIQVLHRVRELKIKSRVALGNQIRGVLAEFGQVIPKGSAKIKKVLPYILEDADNNLPCAIRSCLSDLYEEWLYLQQKIATMDQQLEALCKENARCIQLMTMPGIGPIIASILSVSLSNGCHFKNGRHFAAWLGLVPRQHSTGDKASLKGISKRGNVYVRTQLINGARSVMTRVSGKTDRLSVWCSQLKTRVPFNKAIVALANKMARMAWAMVSHGENFQLKEVV